LPSDKEPPCKKVHQDSSHMDKAQAGFPNYYPIYSHIPRIF
jgi:hypothetical protein